MATKKKPAPAKKTKAVVKRERGGLPVKSIDMARDAGMGFEGADADAYALPFLVLLQKMSPQCDRNEPQFVKGAEPGTYFETSTQTVLGEDVLVIPVAFQRRITEWIPRDDGGGFRGSHDPANIDLTKMDRGKGGAFVDKQGHEFRDTRYHYVIVLREGQRGIAALFPLTSTQIKKSRAWMTAMQALRVDDGNGNQITPPMFGAVWKLSSVGEKNDQGSWSGVSFAFERFLGEEDGDEELYAEAKKFAMQVSKGAVRIDEARAAQNARAAEPEDAPAEY